MWAELPRLIKSARQHVDQHPDLHIASLDVSATDVGPGRVEVHVSGPRAQSCARLLHWRDTLSRSSTYLQVEADPQQPKAMVFGRLLGGTAVTVVAPLSEEDTIGIPRDRIGEWVLHWLRMQAVETLVA
ncbi:hypothetical protein JOD54_001072 [Actinokineospora baliensis]|uniref:hypothetical protein n=1 Tax=Actinokineospora baliensis TaxID=547056 RepID=UPI001959D637|nr:hypothetical protein [Actinokineospora baliensis]MBM7770868.1 hypothetical protein [Actinokineospora baliensis]